MIVISAFNPEGMLDETDVLHRDNPFDGVDIIKMLPFQASKAEADEFVRVWMEEHPTHKVMIDSFTVTL